MFFLYIKAAPNKGDIAGTAVVWQHGTVQHLPPGAGINQTNSINNLGEVAGTLQLADGSLDAMVWRDEQLTDLGRLPCVPTASHGGVGVALNDRGQVVGLSQTASGDFHAVIWDHGQITDLSYLIPSGNLHLMVTQAVAINNRGQILVQEQFNGEGPSLSFLLTPKAQILG